MKSNCMTTEEFIRRAKLAHGDTYDYTLTKYTHSANKVTIICKIHGEFAISATSHVKKEDNRGCPHCGNLRKLESIRSTAKQRRFTTESFIAKSKEIHGDRYDYSKVIYNLSTKPVTIICKKHGTEFYQRPNDHIQGQGCPTCGREILDTVIQERSNKCASVFVEKAKKVHGDIYDYSQVVYTKARKNVTLVCPTHGPWQCTPDNHLRGKGCAMCSTVKRGLTKKSTIGGNFENLARAVHGDKFDYSKAEYNGTANCLTIICPEHGAFRQSAGSHLAGRGCRKCEDRKKADKQIMEFASMFVDRANKIHENRYDYSQFVYKRAIHKSTIICKKHGPFLQSAHCHLMGQGCPDCIESLGEMYVAKWLKSNHVKFVRQYRIQECRNKRPLPFDFYLPEYNALIEYNGIQHFLPRDKWGDIEGLEGVQHRDQIKLTYCQQNNIPLLIIPYTEVENIPQLIETFLKGLSKV